jgi:hypothetical protein
MSPLDAFLAELRAVCGGDFPESERMETTFRILETSDAAPMVAEHDRVVEIVRRPLPLLDRMIALKAMMHEPLP